jgi:hypothetical protein
MDLNKNMEITSTSTLQVNDKSEEMSEELATLLRNKLDELAAKKETEGINYRKTGGWKLY